MYICPECQILLDESQIRNNRCPVIVNHNNPHKPLLKADPDIAHPILLCLKKGYHITGFSGAKRYHLDDSENKFQQLNPVIPFVTFGFSSKLDCESFYKKFKHLNHLMQNWDFEELQRFYRTDEELQVIGSHVLHSKRSQRHHVEMFRTNDFFEIRFIGGGTKFSPAILWDSIYFRDLTEEQQEQRKILLRDFHDSYFTYCKDFFSIFDEICA